MIPAIHIVQRYPPALGGAESYFARLSRHLADHHGPVAVHSSNALDLQAFWSPDGRRLPAGREPQGQLCIQRHAVRYFPARKWLLKGCQYLPNPWFQGLTLPASPQLPSLWAQTADRRIRLVHATAFPYSMPLFAGLRWARRADVPFFLTPFLHLGDPRDPGNRQRRAYLSPALVYLLRAADCVFVQTRLEQEAVLAEGIPNEKVVLQGLGVDPAECTGGNRARAALRWSIPDDAAVRIGHLANLSEEKGTNDLLRALSLLHEWGVPFRGILAGPAMPNFRRFWRQLPAAFKRQVQVLGRLADADKPDFFAAIDLFALPSRSDSFGLVLLEAWANGVPCVGYRCGGIAEVIRDQEDGLLVETGQVNDLAAALRRCVEQEAIRSELGQRGRKRVMREHRWEEKLAVVQWEYERRG